LVAQDSAGIHGHETRRAAAIIVAADGKAVKAEPFHRECPDSAARPPGRAGCSIELPYSALTGIAFPYFGRDMHRGLVCELPIAVGIRGSWRIYILRLLQSRSPFLVTSVYGVKRRAPGKLPAIAAETVAVI
jgi:hypothetical protein